MTRPSIGVYPNTASRASAGSVIRISDRSRRSLARHGTFRCAGPAPAWPARRLSARAGRSGRVVVADIPARLRVAVLGADAVEVLAQRVAAVALPLLDRR